LDGFDPGASQVPVRDRPDLDPGILSDCTAGPDARREFERTRAELLPGGGEVVDDKLSNWYVRRNRRRFWKSEKGTDKLAAYETL